MKKLVILLFLALFFWFPGPMARAQNSPLSEQNVVLSCLEPTNTELVLTGGELNDYSTGLYDKAGIFKEENGPVYVLISYPIPGFKPADSKFADTCEHRHNSNLEGQYWFCADLKDNGSQCAPNMLKPNTQIMKPADAPKEPSDPNEDSCLKTIFQIDSPGFENGQFKVPWAKMYTLLHNNVQFWGMQFTSDNISLSATPIVAAESFALKLAAFIGDTSPGIPTGANSNCTTISWDPYGRIIDAYTLEPIRDVMVSLKNANNNNVLELTVNSNDPTFRNPLSSNSQGGFNFAVIPGTYYLYPEHPNFTFPIIETSIYQTALTNLGIFDPLQEYVKINQLGAKLYQNPQEAIVEIAGSSQRRDMIMQPTDPNYAGSAPELISVQNSRQGIKQFLKGIVSHPKSIIRVKVGEKEIATAIANMEGVFELYLPEDKIPASGNNFQVTVEKVPLVKPLTQTPVSNKTSEALIFNLIPAALSGFVFDQNQKLVPNAKVELVISSIGMFPYTTVYSDANGFISLDNTQLPATEFYLQIYPANSQTSLKLTIPEFKTLNSIYFKQSGVNLYNPKIATEKFINPGQDIINQVKNQSHLATPSALPSGQPVTSKPTNVFVMLVLLAALVIIAIVILRKLKQTKLPAGGAADQPPIIPPIQ